jgi:SH3-like domain-containing protein
MSAMKYFLIFSLAVLGQWTASADMGAIVKADRVNVRKEASITAEVIKQVNKDTLLVAVERHEITPSHQDEPVSWIKVRLTSTNAWVKSSYLDDKDQVQADLLNLRGGPGTEHQKIGQVNRGETVKRLETKGDWTKVQVTDSYGFIAESYITLTEEVPDIDEEPSAKADEQPAQTSKEEKEPAADSSAASAIEIKPAIATQPPAISLEPVEEAAIEPAEEIEIPVMEPIEIPAPKPIQEPPPPAAPVVAPVPAAPIEVAPIETNRQIESTPTPAATDSLERIVLREGVVRPTGSPAAPSPYGLYSIQDNRLINFLYVTNSDIILKNYSGKKVHVRGPESIDSRWRNHPLLTVRTIELLSRR